MRLVSYYLEAQALVPISSKFKVTIPTYDFTITGSSIDGLNRKISFTTIRTIPSGFRLIIIKLISSNGSYRSAGVTSLTNGTTTIVQSCTPSVVRTSQMSITPNNTPNEPNTTYTCTVGEDFITGNAGGSIVVNNTYRIGLLHDSHTTGEQASFIRFDGSYLFGFNGTSIIEH